jgi:methyl-accepting chemotaxis protein
MVKKDSPIRDALLAFVVVLIIASASSIIIYSQSKKVIQEELEERLENTTLITSKFIDITQHEKMWRNPTTYGADHQYINATLKKIINGDAYVAAMQTIVMHNNKFLVLTRTTKEAANKESSSLSPSAVISVIKEPSATLRKLFNTPNAMPESEISKNDYSMIQSYAPIKDSRGNTKMVIAASMDTGTLKVHVKEMEHIFLIANLISVLFSLIVALIVFDAKKKQYQSNLHKKSARDVSNIYKETVQEIIQTFAASSHVLHQASNTINTTAHMVQEDTNNSSVMIEQFSHNIANLNSANQQLSEQLARLLDNAITCNDIAKDTSERVGKAAQSFGTIGQSSEKTAAAIKLILDVSSRIDLLAVNAAIEAARAGDFGRGFGVVAGEVKSLSQEAKKAAETISSLLKHSEETVKESMEAVHSIRGSVHETNYMSEELSNLAKSQQVLQQNINEALKLLTEQSNRLKQSLVSVSSHAEDAAYKTTEMSIMSEQLRQNSKKLELESDYFLKFLNGEACFVPKQQMDDTSAIEVNKTHVTAKNTPPGIGVFEDFAPIKNGKEMVLEAVPIQQSAA